jgi:hypothetical protein
VDRQLQERLKILGMKATGAGRAGGKVPRHTLLAILMCATLLPRASDCVLHRVPRSDLSVGRPGVIGARAGFVAPGLAPSRSWAVRAGLLPLRQHIAQGNDARVTRARGRNAEMGRYSPAVPGLRCLGEQVTGLPGAARWPFTAVDQLPGRRQLGKPAFVLQTKALSEETAAATRADKLSTVGVGPVKSGWGAQVNLEEEGLLPQDPNLVNGELSNGLRYSILRNKVPPGRFFVNLEVHAGSIDEAEDQQGLAHFLEHMLFLGSEAYPHPENMRKVLTSLGMSQLADANAYTDFRSTVYTLSAPTVGTSEHLMHENPMAARKDTLFRAGLYSCLLVSRGCISVCSGSGLVMTSHPCMHIHSY